MTWQPRFLTPPTCFNALATSTSLPFVANGKIDISWFYIPFVILVIIASLFHLLSVLISQRKKIIFNIKNGPIRIGNDKNVSIIEYLIRNSFGFAFNAPISIIFTIFGVLDLLIIYNLSIMPLVLVFTIVRK